MEDVMELFFELLYAGFKKCGHKVMPERFWKWLERQSRSQRKAIKALLYTASFVVAVGICVGVCALIWLLLKRLGFWR